ncbi:MAG: TonB-dependent receptor [Chitinophagaceae bacterium]|nr:MAG: TonB-dependent receptor [Chitinophagaceae bacterium]
MPSLWAATGSSIPANCSFPPTNKYGRDIFMLYMKTATLLLLFFITSAHYACSQVISGHVATANEKPLSLVSVALLKDSSFIAGAVTNESGDFQLKANFSEGTTYTVQLSLIGYQPFSKKFTWPDATSLTKLILLDRENTLGEVVVSSKKPLVTRRSDRYIVNVENSYLANGNSGLDVLQRSPGLWVSPDGSIRITGGQTVTVMINDVVQRMGSAELADFLRSLRSEDISKIEVIPNPPAEFEAASSGGIVHIILKKSRRDGLTGTLSAQYKQQNSDPYSALGASLDYKLKQLYLFGGYNFNNDQNAYKGWTNVLYPDKSNIYNNTRRYNNNTRHQFRAGLVYDFSANHSINFQMIGVANKLIQSFHSGLEYTMPAEKVTGNAISDWRRKPWQASYTLNYGWKMDTMGSQLRIIADYTTSTKKEVNELNSTYSDPLRDQYYRTNTPSNTGLSSIQADYTKALRNQSAIKSGIKYVYTDRGNTVLTERFRDNDWTKDPAASNEFQYTEALLMFYGSFEKVFNKTSIKAGLRGEKTWAEGYSITLDQTINREYFGWFPSLFITHSFNEEKGNSLSLNYSRRVRRPGYNDLNPYRLQVHDFTVLTGNPNLMPQYTHSVRGGYTYLQNYTASVYFQSTSNYIAQTASTIDNNIIEYKSKNYPNSTEYGIALEASIGITKNWNSRNSFMAYRFSNDLDTVRVSQQSFSFQTIQMITWKKVADFDMFLEYTSPYIRANNRQYEIFYIDIGITRKLWKDRGRLRFYVSDIFNTFREKELTQFNNTRIDFYQKRPTRTFGLSLAYTFRAGKAFTKKRIDQNNSDEKNRL